MEALRTIALAWNIHKKRKALAAFRTHLIKHGETEHPLAKMEPAEISAYLSAGQAVAILESLNDAEMVELSGIVADFESPVQPKEPKPPKGKPGPSPVVAPENGDGRPPGAPEEEPPALVVDGRVSSPAPVSMDNPPGEAPPPFKSAVPPLRDTVVDKETGEKFAIHPPMPGYEIEKTATGGAQEAPRGNPEDDLPPGMLDAPEGGPPDEGEPIPETQTPGNPEPHRPAMLDIKREDLKTVLPPVPSHTQEQAARSQETRHDMQRQILEQEGKNDPAHQLKLALLFMVREVVAEVVTESGQAVDPEAVRALVAEFAKPLIQEVNNLKESMTDEALDARIHRILAAKFSTK